MANSSFTGVYTDSSSNDSLTGTYTTDPTTGDNGLTSMLDGLFSTDDYFSTGDYNGTYNGTGEPPPADVSDRDERLYLAYNILVALNSAIMTFAMGAGVQPSQVLMHIKKPVGPIIGTVCQSLIMPVLCFAYAVLVSLDGRLALGMIITGSCPGGAMSNIFTYWSRGNLTLSVAMTVFSTTLSIGFMPLNMFMYTRYWRDEGEDAAIPYGNMVFSMLYTWVAAAIGMLIAWKAPKGSKYITRVGSIFGVVFMISLGFLQNEIYNEMFNIPMQAWAGALSMPAIGFLIGFAISSMFCLDLARKKAISYETGTQNVAVALSVISLSFDREFVGEISSVPMVYAFSQIIIGLVTSIFQQLYYRAKEGKCPFKKCASSSPDSEDDTNDAPDDSQTADGGITSVSGTDNLAYTHTESLPGPDGSNPTDTSTSPPRTSVLWSASDPDSIHIHVADDSNS